MTADLHTVHLEGSYAREAGSSVCIVLGLFANQDATLHGPQVQMRLLRRQPRHGVLVSASLTDSDHGPLLRATLPSSRLKRGVYHIAVREAPGGSFVRVQARLVVARGRRPLALLPGPIPRTVMPPPAPREKDRAGAPGSARERLDGRGAHPSLGRRSAEAAERLGRAARDLLPGR